jgi:hypothetical protein
VLPSPDTALRKHPESTRLHVKVLRFIRGGVGDMRHPHKMLIGNLVDSEEKIILEWILNIMGVAEDKYP